MYRCLSVTLLFLFGFPDEGALVKAAQTLGFVFSGRTPDTVIVQMVSWTRRSMKGMRVIILRNGFTITH